MAWFQARQVNRELEARFASPSGGGARGKAERKWYANGAERFRLRARGLEAPDGATASVTIAGRTVTVRIVRDSKLEFEIESGSGQAVPETVPGDTITIEYAGEGLASGVFQVD